MQVLITTGMIVKNYGKVVSAAITTMAVSISCKTQVLGAMDGSLRRIYLKAQRVVNTNKDAHKKSIDMMTTSSGVKWQFTCDSSGILKQWHLNDIAAHKDFKKFLLRISSIMFLKVKKHFDLTLAYLRNVQIQFKKRPFF